MAMLRWSDEQLAAYHRARTEAEDECEARPRAKYRNKKVTIDGRKFDSKAEGARYLELKRLEEAGVISALRCQVPFALEINGNLICKYIADFTYADIDRRRVVEDVKGHATREYTLKKKLMKALHGIEIREVRKGKHARQT